MQPASSFRGPRHSLSRSTALYVLAMGSSYAAESILRSMMHELIRLVAPSCAGIELVPLPGPFRPQNWRIGKLDVLAEHYGSARDKADELEAMKHWIVVPDGHHLSGQVYGRETAGRVGE